MTYYCFMITRASILPLIGVPYYGDVEYTCCVCRLQTNTGVTKDSKFCGVRMLKEYNVGQMPI